MLKELLREVDDFSYGCGQALKSYGLDAKGFFNATGVQFRIDAKGSRERKPGKDQKIHDHDGLNDK